MRNRLALSFLLLSAGAAVAGGASSTYTSFDLKHCKALSAANSAEEWGGSSLCPGLGSLNIYFAEGDLRTMVAFGTAPATHCAATQSFGGFNSASTKVEWRLRDGKPVATILRWTVSYDPNDSEKTKTWLVVTKLEAKNSCRVAAVEGALPDANQKARDAADKLAAAFNCAKDTPKIVSATPTKAEELMSGVPCSAD